MKKLARKQYFRAVGVILGEVMIQVHQDKECSKCGALNRTDYVSRGKKTYLRCKECGHEKLFATFTTGSMSLDGNVVYIKVPPVPDKEVF